MSEWTLLLCGIALFVRVMGEYFADHKKKEYPFFKKYKHRFEVVVIIAIAGELFGDGGVFVFGTHLQTIADAQLGQASKDAGAAITQAGLAKLEAAKADERAAVTESNNLSLAMQVEQLKSNNNVMYAELHKVETNTDFLEQPVDVNSLSADVILSFHRFKETPEHPWLLPENITWSARLTIRQPKTDRDSPGIWLDSDRAAHVFPPQYVTRPELKEYSSKFPISPAFGTQWAGRQPREILARQTVREATNDITIYFLQIDNFSPTNANVCDGEVILHISPRVSKTFRLGEWVIRNGSGNIDIKNP